MKWIPTKERLPEKSGRYIVQIINCGEFGVMITSFSAMHQKFNANDCFEDCEHAFEDEDVLAWMPTPKPYKGE